MGGRQGCVFGTVIFNGAYGIALNMMSTDLIRDGVTLRLPRKECAFWSGYIADAKHVCDENIIDAAFVDECIVLLAKSPNLLNRAIHKMLDVVCRVFRALRMEINWKRGKTEIMVQYRGKEASKCYDKIRHHDGMYIDWNVLNGERLCVVDSYRHLGSELAVHLSLKTDASEKINSTLSAYCAMAGRVFKAHGISVDTKLSLAHTLLWSRLFFNCHIHVHDISYMAALNHNYMRVLRAITDKANYGAVKTSDAEVRKISQQPSIECIMMRRRLGYLSRLLRHAPGPLVALLQSRPGGKQLKWVRLIVQDLEHIHKHLPSLSHMPTPTENCEAWFELVVRFPREWKQNISAVFSVDSVLDRRRARMCELENDLFGFRCNLCDSQAVFATRKALLMHQRIKHGVRTIARLYVDGSGICPGCGTNFRQRLRCIAHLSDARRPKCHMRMLASDFKILHNDEASRLDALDRDLRLKFKRLGRNTPIAIGSAIMAQGKKIGFAKH